MNDFPTSSDPDSAPRPGDDARKRWMSILARSEPARLEALWKQVEDQPTYRLIRPPQVGLMMVRARAGGTGQRFNLGEMAVSRCAVTTGPGHLGIGYVRGRRLRHAELAAVFDALLQDPARQDRLEREVVQSLLNEQLSARARRSEETAATKVEFFTLVRGEDT